MRTIRSTTEKIIVTDCRYPNEARFIRSAGGRLLRIKRGDDPEWLKDVATVDLSDEQAVKMFKEGRAGGCHESEWAWAQIDPATYTTIDNNGTIDELWAKVRDAVSGS